MSRLLLGRLSARGMRSFDERVRDEKPIVTRLLREALRWALLLRVGVGCKCARMEEISGGPRKASSEEMSEVASSSNESMLSTDNWIGEQGVLTGGGETR